MRERPNAGECARQLPLSGVVRLSCRGSERARRKENRRRGVEATTQGGAVRPPYFGRGFHLSFSTCLTSLCSWAQAFPDGEPPKGTILRRNWTDVKQLTRRCTLRTTPQKADVLCGLW